MEALNYHHLRYFWHAAKEGSVTGAAEALHVSQPAVSTQIRKLEEALGHPLFDRKGRSMELTPEGRMVLGYADEIFQLGRELEETARRGLDGRPTRLGVGLSASIPNLVAFHLLEPVFQQEDPARVVVREKSTDLLLGDLSTGSLDVVLADMPIPPHVNVRAFNHPLGSSPVDILGPPLLAHRLREGFPGSLEGVPFVLPTEGYTLRRSLEDWFHREGVQPSIFAEIEDNDLINVLAEAGGGLFAAPSIITPDIRVRYAVEVVGRARGVREDFFVITAGRRLRHPAVAALTRAARSELSEALSAEVSA